jgi:quinolinate synthase
MKNNSLSDIEQALRNPTPQQIIEISEKTRLDALKTIQTMFKYTK